MKFLTLCEKFEEIEKISSRNTMVEKLSELYKGANSDEVQIISYLLLGRVAPLFVTCEFNYSEKSFLNSVSGVFKGDMQKLRKDVGDVGDVAFGLASKNEKISSLSVEKMYELLWKVVNETGTGSQEKKSTLIIHTFLGLTPLEAKFFARIVCSNLRMGASVKTLLDSFSFSIQGDKGLRKQLDDAYGVCSDAGFIARAVFSKDPTKEISEIKASPGIPILPRLVERTKSFDEVMERMGESFYIQPKFDGLRLQIHKNEKGFEDVYQERIWSKFLRPLQPVTNMFGAPDTAHVKLFTRNLEDVTKMFPEIVKAANDLPVKSIVLDGEVVGWDSKKKTFKSYQDTMTRKRKYSVTSVSESIPVKVFAFDTMYFDGKELISEDLFRRMEYLKIVLSENEKKDIILTQTITSPNKPDLERQFNTWVGMGLEGLIAKFLVGGYTPGGRNFEWVKLKRSFMSDLNDSVDVVILGYFYGSGKRANFGIGALLCGVYNKDEDRFESVSKLGTGVSDGLWKTILDRLQPLVEEECPKSVLISENLKPDVYVYPEVVCTIEADDVTRSVVQEYKNEPAKGLSLRFPRMIEFDRDALPTDATTVEELEEMFVRK